MQCAIWNSPTNCCAAGISLDFSSMSICARNQAKFGTEGVQQLGCLAVSEIVETSPGHLSIKLNGVSRRVGRIVQKARGIAAEYLPDALRIKTLVDVANGGMGRRALPAQTECRVQPAAVHRDESFERAIGIAPADHGEDREQQDVGQLIQYSFPSARRGSGISPSKPINSSNDRKAIAWLIGCRA